MDIQTALINYGLNEKEISVYLFLLQHGAKTAHELSRGTGILRQSVYDIIGSLKHKGLVSEVNKNDKKNFMAENPDSFISSLKEKEENIKKILPNLNALKDTYKIETNAKLYQGIKGIKLLYEDFLKSKTEIKTIQPEIPEEVLKEYFVENFSIKRIKNKIIIKILKKKIATEFQKKINTDKGSLREVKISEQLKDFKAHFVLYENKIAMIDYRSEPVATLIENEFFARSFNTLFDSLWKSAKIF